MVYDIKSISKQDLHKSNMCILVLSAMFPSINQPWMDTYLEQLKKNKLNFLIYSANRNPGKYHAKVDRLGLHQSIINVDFRFCSLIRTFLKFSLLHPVKFFETAQKAFVITYNFRKQYRLNALKVFLKLTYFGLKDTIFSKFNIIHSHGETLAFEFIFLSHMRNIPIVYTLHGLLPKGVPPLADMKRKALYAEITHVLVNTNFALKQAQAIGCPPEKIIIIPQGLPLSEYAYISKPCPNIHEYLCLLTVGRLHRQKGYGYSLLAIARLLRHGLKLEYHIVGTGPDIFWMRTLINRFGISGHVTIHEGLEKKDLDKFYQKAHIFILPSLSNPIDQCVETQGVVLQEAQASGCIPIATRVGGIPECVNDKLDAILVKDRSSKAICEAVRYLFDRPEEWQSYQENGRRNVEQNFSADVIGKKMAAILRGIAAEGKKN